MNNVQRGLAAALALNLLGACADDLGSEQSAASAPAEQANPAGGDRTDNDVATEDSTPGGLTDTDTAGAEGPATGAPAGGPDNSPLAGRSLVIRMTIGVEVTDVGAAVDQVIELATSHDAQLFDSSVHIDGSASAGGDLVFKVPPEEVDAFLTSLDPAVGTRVLLEGDTADVTRQLADLDAQILSAVASVDRVRALLEDATTLGDVVLLEGELTARQTHLEQLLAQKAGLADQVAMATITVRLSQAPEPMAEPEPATPKKTDGIGEAFAKGWRAFLAAVKGVLLFVGYTGPFLVLLLLALLAASVVRRRRSQPRNRSAAPPHPPAPVEGPRTSEPDSAGAARIP